MSTNYYLQKPKQNYCSHCGRYDQDEPMHIGKSSIGWCFGLHVYPELNIHDLDDWIPLFKQHQIINEYNEPITVEQMLQSIKDRYSNKDWNSSKWWSGAYTSENNFHSRNYSQRGPNNLLRHALNNWCIKHGDGTWDCIVGEFS